MNFVVTPVFAIQPIDPLGDVFTGQPYMDCLPYDSFFGVGLQRLPDLIRRLLLDWSGVCLFDCERSGKQQFTFRKLSSVDGSFFRHQWLDLHQGVVGVFILPIGTLSVQEQIVDIRGRCSSPPSVVIPPVLLPSCPLFLPLLVYLG